MAYDHDDAIAYLYSLSRKDKKLNVFFSPLISLSERDGKRRTFNCYTRKMEECYYHTYINGKYIMINDNLKDGFGISLKPGNYKIRIVVFIKHALGLAYEEDFNFARENSLSLRHTMSNPYWVERKYDHTYDLTITETTMKYLCCSGYLHGLFECKENRDYYHLKSADYDELIYYLKEVKEKYSFKETTKEALDKTYKYWDVGINFRYDKVSISQLNRVLFYYSDIEVKTSETKPQSTVKTISSNSVKPSSSTTKTSTTSTIKPASTSVKTTPTSSKIVSSSASKTTSSTVKNTNTNMPKVATTSTKTTKTAAIKPVSEAPKPVEKTKTVKMTKPAPVKRNETLNETTGNYEGETLDHVKHGIGVYKYKDPNKYYTGLYRNGKKNGTGALIDLDKYSNFGIFKDDSFQGFGIKVFHILDNIQIGYFLNGVEDGISITIDENNTASINLYDNGKLVKVIKEIPNFTKSKIDTNLRPFKYFKYDNCTYIGQVKNDDPDGFGRFDFDDGDVYIGQFKNGNANGLGIFLTSSNAVYMGNFKDLAYEGYGIRVAEDNTYKMGLWKDDELIKKMK